MKKAKNHFALFFLEITFLFLIQSLMFGSVFKGDLTSIAEIEIPSNKEEDPVKAEIFLIDYMKNDKIKIGIYFKIEPGWYLYWLNPGEAGLPPQVEWELPAGLSLESLEFPTPEKFISSGYVVYGYKNELLLQASFSVPDSLSFPSSKQAVIKARVNWMVCRESCLLGEKELWLDLFSSQEDERKDFLLIWEKFKSRFPRPQEEIEVKVKEVKLIKIDRIGPSGKIKVFLELVGKDLPKIKDFFPLPLENFIIDEAMTRYDAGTIEIGIIPLKDEWRIESLRGLLVGETSSYLVNFSIPNATALISSFSQISEEKFLLKLENLRRLRNNVSDR